ncbi:MAG: zf-TFIIB domain-containing protein [Candidatus Brocadiia bacterium]
MLCPVCEHEMLVLEFEQVEVDYCARCEGVWLDSGELELLGERAGALEGELLGALQRPDGSPPAGRRPCPVCDHPMDETATGTDPPITVDRCRRGHGLWFDHGELRRLVRAAGAPEDNVLARFFAELGTSN